MEFFDNNSLINIQSALKTNILGKNLIFLEDVDSTNNYLKTNFRDMPSGTVVIALRQTKGKGTKGRSWDSPEGGIWMSFLLKGEDAINIKNVNKITEFVTIAVIRAIHLIIKNHGDIPRIKRPNDIHVNGKKVCGILAETSFAGEKIDYCVTGIGININNNEFPEELKNIATSLSAQYNEKINIVFAATTIIEELEKIYYKLVKDESVTEEFESLLINYDK